MLSIELSRVLGLASCFCIVACGASTPKSSEAPMTPSSSSSSQRTTFADDIAFLAKHSAISILESEGGGRIAVSPAYQGRVMTSAVAESGESLGWVHRDFIAAGKTGTVFDNYGGEDRFWLGPEGGQFGLYFAAGAPFTFDKWQTPAAFQEGAWAVTARTRSSIAFARSLVVSNHAGTVFQMDVARDIPLSDAVKWVAFETVNTVTNVGPDSWVEATGLVSVWVLGMFAPAPDAKVIVPFAASANVSAPIVNDAYFGKVSPDRLKVDERDGLLVFTCDGQSRGKIGLGPARARPIAASFSASQRLLTIVQYDKPEKATRYVNSMWE
jgi:hypothetical protein